MQKFDLIVIGGGTGLDIASAASLHGLKVAIIEKDRLGGTCLNRGCIPSKLLIHSADVAEIIKNAGVFGININGYSVDFEKIMNRVNKITDSDSDEIKKQLLQTENPKLFTKECRFVGKNQIAFKSTDEKRSLGNNNENNENKKESDTNTDRDTDATRTTAVAADDDDDIITAEIILIASGAKPYIPKITGLEGSGYITSDQVFRLKNQPGAITFIGGGYVACELAHFFGSLGTNVNIIQKNKLLIPNEDIDIAENFTSIFREKYNVYTGFIPESVSKVDNPQASSGSKNFHVVAKNINNGETIEIDSDHLLVSAGRIPNTDSLELEKTGVSLDENGYIKVNEYLETSSPGIFALGDVIGRYQFKHSANHEAQYAFINILNKYHNNTKDNIKVDYTAMPHAIFSSPQVAGVGFTEQELENKNTDYLKSVYPYFNTGMGEAIEDRDGFVKFLVDKNDRTILGCHIMGTDASTLIHEVVVAMKSGRGVIDDITNTIHIHPALSEVIDRAAGNVGD